MERFIDGYNIERYRRLADETTEPAERLWVIELLAEQWANFELELKVHASMVRGTAACVRGFEPPREEQRGAD
jgi:hypothetical protein